MYFRIALLGSIAAVHNQWPVDLVRDRAQCRANVGIADRCPVDIDHSAWNAVLRDWAQPKRITEADGIPARVRVQVRAAREADRVLRQVTPDRRSSLRPDALKPLAFFFLAAEPLQLLIVIWAPRPGRALRGGSEVRSGPAAGALGARSPA